MKSWLSGLMGLTLIVVLGVGCGSAAPTPTATPSPGSDIGIIVVQAPIESVEIEKVAAKPPNSSLIVVSGGLNSCESFNDYTMTRDGDTFRVEVTNLKQVGLGLPCTANYGMVTTSILLPSDLIEPCKTYTVVVNGESYSVRASCPIIPSGQFPEPTATPAETPNSTWLTGLIRTLENEPVANPPAFIAQYEYKGQTVYFLPQRCCDIFSNLYDTDGNIIGHPDGGITGQGDGRASDFFEERQNERIIWVDQRTYDPGLVQVPAPIESVEILIMESFPPQYSMVVVSGLPNACVSFGGYRIADGGEIIRVEIINLEPTDKAVVCAQVYSTVKTNIPLGADFESGKSYAVAVNDVTEIFIAQ